MERSRIIAQSCADRLTALLTATLTAVLTDEIAACSGRVCALRQLTATLTGLLTATLTDPGHSPVSRGVRSECRGSWTWLSERPGLRKPCSFSPPVSVAVSSAVSPWAQHRRRPARKERRKCATRNQPALSRPRASAVISQLTSACRSGCGPAPSRLEDRSRVRRGKELASATEGEFTSAAGALSSQAAQGHVEPRCL